MASDRIGRAGDRIKPQLGGHTLCDLLSRRSEPSHILLSLYGAESFGSVAHREITALLTIHQQLFYPTDKIKWQIPLLHYFYGNSKENNPPTTTIIKQQHFEWNHFILDWRIFPLPVFSQQQHIQTTLWRIQIRGAGRRQSSLWRIRSIFIDQGKEEGRWISKASPDKRPLHLPT